ncbi:flagellar biosynthesis protein FlhF [gamma proteobacterium HTCC5015]|nr:flagellar biosynthesis protein FlhF [gamma proteobacterium HTCC5015]
MSLKHHLQRWLPNPEKLKQDRRLKILGEWLHDPNIWHINRNSVCGAVAIGFGFAWMPIPAQMLLASIAAIYWRKNLPLAFVSTWITNPITMGPMFYFAYWLGTLFLDTPAMHLEIELSLDWVFTELGARWRPFFLGCAILSVFSSAIGYFGMQLMWRYHVLTKLKKRRQARLEARQRRRAEQHNNDH